MLRLSLAAIVFALALADQASAQDPILTPTPTPTPPPAAVQPPPSAVKPSVKRLREPKWTRRCRPVRFEDLVWKRVRARRMSCREARRFASVDTPLRFRCRRVERVDRFWVRAVCRYRRGAFGFIVTNTSP